MNKNNLAGLVVVLSVIIAVGTFMLRPAVEDQTTINQATIGQATIDQATPGQTTIGQERTGQEAATTPETAPATATASLPVRHNTSPGFHARKPAHPDDVYIVRSNQTRVHRELAAAEPGDQVLLDRVAAMNAAAYRE